MPAAYAAADMVVSRSGAMAVAEIAMTGKACIFVPYPHAAEDHQTFNAEVLVKEKAARMIADKNVIDNLNHFIEEHHKSEVLRKFDLPIANKLLYFLQS